MIAQVALLHWSGKSKLVLALHNQTRIANGESYAKERGVVCGDRRYRRNSFNNGS